MALSPISLGSTHCLGFRQRSLSSGLYLSIATTCVMMHLSCAHASVLSDKYTPFELHLQAVSSQMGRDIETSLNSLDNWKIRPTSTDDLALVNAIQCEIYANKSETKRIQDLLVILEENIKQNSNNLSLRSARELCAFFSSKTLTEKDQHVSAAYYYGRMSPLASIRYWVSSLYVDLCGRQGRGRDAIEAARIGLNIARNNDDHWRLALSLRALASLEVDLNDKENALEHLDEALELSRNLGATQLEGVILNNRINVLLAMRKLMEARLAIEKASEFSKKIEHDPNAIWIKLNLAQLNYLEGHYQASQALVEQVLVQATDIQDKNILLAYAHALLALNYYRYGRSDLAEPLFKDAMKTLTEQNLRVELKDFYEQVAEAQLSLSNYKQAYTALKERNDYADKIEHESRGHHADELRNLMQTEKREQENLSLREQSLKDQTSVEEAKLRLQRWWLIALALSMSLLLALQLIWSTRKRNRLLQNLNQELDLQRYQDALTQVHNRRFLIEHEAEFWAQTQTMQEQGRCAALLLIDIDHFKRINDEHSHAAGDAALVDIAARLQKTVRESDTVIRWGGEEFLIFAKATDSQAIRTLTERIMRAIQCEPVRYEEKQIMISASIGYVLLPLSLSKNEVFTIEESLKMADAALYRAKEHGRNRAYGINAILGSQRGKTQLIRELSAAIAEGEINLTEISPSES